MAEEHDGPDLELSLLRYGGLSTWYDAKAGQRRRLTLFGLVENGEDTAFRYKPVRLNIYSPADPAWLKEVRTSLGEEHACGSVAVTAGVESECVDIEPIAARLDVSAEAFEAISSQAMDADDRNRMMGATLTLSGNAIPDPRRFNMFLEDLDVSKAQEYAVTDFEINNGLFDDLRGRVMEVERGMGEGFDVRVTVLLTNVSYKILTDRALVYSISCEGRVTDSGRTLDGANIRIEFNPFDSSRGKELPLRAFFGRFNYYPKQPNEIDSSAGFGFELRYVPKDARDLLIPLFSQEPRTQVVLTIYLIKNEEELFAATDTLSGDVRGYSFEVSRNLIGND